ncbi:hypothetical protein [Vibrio sp. PNB22_3_1]
MTIYRHVAGYEPLGDGRFKLLYKTHQHGSWMNLEVTEDEIASFVTSEDDAFEIAHAKYVHPDYDVDVMLVPLSVRALSFQLAAMGESYNSSWSAFFHRGSQVGFVNHKIGRVALYDGGSRALLRLRPMECEGQYIRLVGVKMDKTLPRVSPALWGAVPDGVQTLGSAKHISVALAEFRDSKHRREVVLS